MQQVPLTPILHEKVNEQGYIRKKVSIQVDSHTRMPFYVLVPTQAHHKLKPIIALHGHDSGGKLSVAGVTEIFPEISGQIEKYNYDYGKQLALQGYMVFCPDARGFGERQEYDTIGNPLKSSCTYLNHLASALGYSLAGLWIWDLMRLIDYIETLPNVQTKSIGAVGLSGGGWQALLLSALDIRVQCAITSGYFYGFQQSLLEVSHCGCNYAPGLWTIVDIEEIGALVAPRALLVETGSQNPLNGRCKLNNVTPQVKKVKEVMVTLGFSEKIKHHIFQGEHVWDGAKAFSWLEKNL